MVPDFRKANWEGFLKKMNNLNWEYLFQGKGTYEMWDIFNLKFTKQFILMKKKRDNQKVKPKQMNGDIKRLQRNQKSIPDSKNKFIRRNSTENIRNFPATKYHWTHQDCWIKKKATVDLYKQAPIQHIPNH